jgi:dual specificity MAP kinase phosphatase
LSWLFELIRRLVLGAPFRRFSQVTPNIFIGGQFRRRGWPIMAGWGITSVVNMRSEFDDSKANIAPEHYLHLPTVDGTPPTMEQLVRGVEFIVDELEAGRTVYIHCEAGVGRAVTMAAAYLVAIKGLSPTEAWKALRLVRPFIRPTLSQKEQLERFSAQAV